MGAQSAQEPSMEDILASIRKIISEDGPDNEKGKEEGNEGSAIGEPAGELNSIVAGQGDSQTAAPLDRRNDLDETVFVERRAYPDGDVASSAAAKASAAASEIAAARRAVLAEKSIQEATKARSEGVPSFTKPINSPEPDEAAAKLSENPANQTAPMSPNSSEAMSRFVERQQRGNSPLDTLQNSNAPVQSPTSQKSADAGIEQKKSAQTAISARSPISSGEALHPAIANAKAFVSNQRVVSNRVEGSQLPEKPVFSNVPNAPEPPAIASAVAKTQLVSPDSLERREEFERRNHPLRRDADRESTEFKQALMSPNTDDAVGSAFEQLKNSATENLDGKVETLLRPMLREWLDNNLPSMVERLVRDEIERVSRGE